MPQQAAAAPAVSFAVVSETHRLLVAAGCAIDQPEAGAAAGRWLCSLNGMPGNCLGDLNVTSTTCRIGHPL